MAILGLLVLLLLFIIYYYIHAVDLFPKKKDIEIDMS